MVDVAEACGALMISMIDLRVARARAPSAYLATYVGTVEQGPVSAGRHE